MRVYCVCARLADSVLAAVASNVSCSIIRGGIATGRRRTSFWVNGGGPRKVGKSVKSKFGMRDARRDLGGFAPPIGGWCCNRAPLLRPRNFRCAFARVSTSRCIGSSVTIVAFGSVRITGANTSSGISRINCARRALARVAIRRLDEDKEEGEKTQKTTRV